MTRFILPFIFLGMLQGNLFSQNNQFPDYHPPLGIPLVLAANFGELRSNHFHMGVDFKTNGRTGYRLYAIEDGYVSRIKVSPYGYGKVLYLDHPDGTTSVYAHCSEFKGRIDSLVKAIQYRTERFEVEIFPAPGDLVVKKGEVIALSGNSGSSTAPHLHFEIRDTESEDCLNPLVYGFDVADHRAPVIRHVKVFPVNKDGYLNNSESREVTVRASSKDYSIAGDTLTVSGSFMTPSGGLGLAFDIIDQLDGAYNQCGLYGTFLIVDGDTLFGQKTDRISFNTTRYINAHRDLSALSRKYHKSYRNIANPLEIYISDGLGIIRVTPDTPREVTLVAYDPKGNTSRLTFFIKLTAEAMAPDFDPATAGYVLPSDTVQITQANWSVQAAPNTLYEPIKMHPDNQPAHFCGAGIPLQKGVDVSLKLEKPILPVERYYIAAHLESGKIKPLETTYKDGWLTATSTYSGKYSIQHDTSPPDLRALSYNNAYIVSTSHVRYTVNERETSLEEYDLYIDGKWYPMEYEPKDDQLFFERPAGLSGTHTIKIVLTDSCKNERVYERTLDFR